MKTKIETIIEIMTELNMFNSKYKKLIKKLRNANAAFVENSRWEYFDFMNATTFKNFSEIVFVSDSDYKLLLEMFN